MSQNEVLTLSELESQRNLAFQRAISIFRSSAYIYIGLYLIKLAATIARLILHNDFSTEALWEILINPISLILFLVVTIYWTTANFLETKLYSAVLFARAVALFGMAIFPVGTIIGIIALIRLFNKRL